MYELDINKYNYGIENHVFGAILENVEEDILKFVKGKLETEHSCRLWIFRNKGWV